MSENKTIESLNGVLTDVAVRTSVKGRKYLSITVEDAEGNEHHINSFDQNDVALESTLKVGELYRVEYYTDKGGYKKLYNITLIEGQTQIDDYNRRRKESEAKATEPDRKERQIIRMSALKDAIDYYKVLALSGDEEILKNVIRPLSPRDIEETAIEFERFIKEAL